ncbi:hypothetical protein TSUD_171040 [Trifolium subterraneum]|uniref:Uncharacterized protein n=1 Tax=Trifolium subterraneum TaxID=3900 RepID=A0A2Z6MBT1_TRISU|nr:hypothetical protein TSUD_171040 [Trifolium subterraneum]
MGQIPSQKRVKPSCKGELFSVKNSSIGSKCAKLGTKCVKPARNYSTIFLCVFTALASPTTFVPLQQGVGRKACEIVRSHDLARALNNHGLEDIIHMIKQS